MSDDPIIFAALRKLTRHELDALLDAHINHSGWLQGHILRHIHLLDDLAAQRVHEVPKARRRLRHG